MKNRKVLWLVAVLVIVTLLLTACGQPNPMKNVPDATGHVYGFWNGAWDGLTVGWAFLINLFGGHYGLYEVHNNGGWYDFGYYVGICLIIESAVSFRRRYFSELGL